MHPFEGMALEVLSWQHRDGEELLTLILPDGTRSLIPSSWTDLNGPPAAQPARLASAEELLSVRIVVDALLRRAGNTKSVSPAEEAEEGPDASAKGAVRDTGTSGGSAGVGRARRTTENRSREDIGASDLKGGRQPNQRVSSREEGGDR